MRVEFTPEALADANAARHLTAIYWLIQDGRHDWTVSDTAALERSAWLRSLGDDLQREVSELARLSARRPTPARVEVTPTGSPHVERTARGWRVPAGQAELWLRAPIELLVENAGIDGTFLRLILLYVGHRELKQRLGPDRFERLKRRWRGAFGDGELFRVLHGGGSTTAEQVTIASESHPDLPPSLFVLLDSDRSAPSDPEGRTAIGVRSAIEQLARSDGWRPTLHVLAKREMENYLPHAALATVRRLDLARVIPPHEADHVDLKVLFPSRRPLAKDVFDNPAAMAQIHEASLRQRAGDDGAELSAIVHDILALL
jgi:hypothetical protein